jgi:DNA end-binding protein Ku
VARPFWSGTITFGLVSVPVDLVAANRARGTALRMLDRRDGQPLTREYYCPKQERALESDEVVRGYPIQGEKFVTVSDEELASVAPEKTRDIDLQRFVDAREIEPLYFRRTYFLLPSGRSSKAYHLLAESMERAGRAGIATFVMRDKEYLVAIFAEGGVLRAATLRFADELRSPEQVGLPKKPKPKAAEVNRMARAIGGLTEKKLAVSELEDEYAAELHKLIEKKQRKRENVVEAPAEAAEEMGADVIDLMEVLKRRIGLPAKAAAAGARRKNGTRRHSSAR